MVVSAEYFSLPEAVSSDIHHIRTPAISPLTLDNTITSPFIPAPRPMPFSPDSFQSLNPYVAPYPPPYAPPSPAPSHAPLQPCAPGRFPFHEPRPGGYTGLLVPGYGPIALARRRRKMYMRIVLGVVTLLVVMGTMLGVAYALGWIRFRGSVQPGKA